MKIEEFVRFTKFPFYVLTGMKFISKMLQILLWVIVRCTSSQKMRIYNVPHFISELHIFISNISKFQICQCPFPNFLPLQITKFQKLLYIDFQKYSKFQVPIFTKMLVLKNVSIFLSYHLKYFCNK